MMLVKWKNKNTEDNELHSTIHRIYIYKKTWERQWFQGLRVFRKIIITILRAKTRLKNHVCRIEIQNLAKCECEHQTQGCFHILTNCPTYNKNR